MIFKTALVLFKIFIVYVLLVLIQENVSDDKFQNFYYIVVFVSIYIWVFDFGAFFNTSKNGIETSAAKISRNLLIQFLCTPLIFLSLSLFFSNNVAFLIVVFSIISYLLLVLKSSFISKNEIISSLLVDYLTLAPFYTFFYIYSDLTRALLTCIIIQIGFLVISYSKHYLILKSPSIKFDKFDKQMFISNIFSLPGSYIDVFFARFFVSDFSIYVLVREAVTKFPSLLQPIYNNIFYPILLKNIGSFQKFFIINAFIYIFLFLLAMTVLSFDIFSESINQMSLLLGVLIVLKGLSSIHGALMMTQMASHLSMIKNIIYLLVFILVSTFSIKFSLEFREWMILLISFYGLSLIYDVYIIYKLRVLTLPSSLLIFSSYVLGLYFCLNYY